MKIDGIDPLLLNRIKEKIDRMEIQRAERTDTENSVRRESAFPRDKRSEDTGQAYERRLDEALDRLNDKAEKDSLPFRFSVRRDSKPWQVQIIDPGSNKIIHDIPTDQALSVVNRIQGLSGVLLDEKR
jgi:uncharacterized FlaG/YvyC family protein